MRISLLGSCFALSAAAFSEKLWHTPIQANQIPPPNTKNDKAANRSRSAKKRRNIAKRGRK